MTHYPNIADRNLSAGLQELFYYGADVVPLLIPMMLFTFYIIVAMASYFSASRLRGEGSFPASLAIAGYTTAVLAILMSLIPDLIDTVSVVFALAVSLAGTLILFTWKENP